MESYPSLIDPATIANPYPLYQRLQEEDPVHWDEEMHWWVLSRYSDVDTALRDPRLSSARAHTIRNLASPDVSESIRQALKTQLSMWTLFQDPPDHTRLRNLVNKAFTPRVIENLRNHIEDIVQELLAKATSVGSLDVICDLAYPLPTMVIAELLGVCREDHQFLKRCSDDFAAILGGVGCGRSVVERAVRSMGEFASYLGKIVADRQQNPKEDLISALLHAEEEGKLLSHDELIANCALLLSAGHETTTNLIGNGTLALLRHPDQLQRLREDPGLIRTAIEELLRFDSPVQAISRIALEDVEIGSRLLCKNDAVLLLLGAANHDPARFPIPESLDLGRANNHHAAFAFGPHYCLGAPLARLEAQVAILALLGTFPDLQLAATKVEWQENFVLRALKSLPVSFSRRRPKPSRESTRSTSRN